MKVKKRIILWILLAFTSLQTQATSPIRSWATDMYNQPNIKPQEEGTFLSFPEGSVTTTGIEINSNGYENVDVAKIPWMDFAPDGFRYKESPSFNNTVEKTAESIENGKYLYGVYCTVCHGSDGKGGTPVGLLRGAPPINATVPGYAEGYLYARITYGGNTLVSMPPFGYSTTEKERWEIVNYLKNTFK